MAEPVPSQVETHISRLFFTEDRAYKLLKPVVLSFLDLSDPARRMEATRRELELNRRLAPDTYLGLGDLHEDGRLVDQMIIMRRMPSDRRLSFLLSDSARSAAAGAHVADAGAGTDDCLRAVARAMATFHAEVDPLYGDAAVAIAGTEATRRRWSDNLTDIGRSAGSVIDADEFERVGDLANRYLDATRDLFAARIAGGFVRDGHGDLIADDIFCLDDGPRILDCLAFRDDFRIGDVLADIGFLVMDVERLAGPETAQRLLGWYQQFAAEQHPASLGHHYIAYRAHVRAKVACVAHEQGRTDQVELARAYHRLALRHCEAARIRVVMIGGAPGVGKSTVSADLGRTMEWPVLVNDTVRKELAGLAHDDHSAGGEGSPLYSSEMTDRVYDELIQRAGRLVTGGESVILDASWSSAAHRELLRALADEAGAELIEVECVLDADEAARRIERRTAAGSDPSDATADIAPGLAAGRDRWPEAIRLSTAGSRTQVGEACHALVAAAPPDRPREAERL